MSRLTSSVDPASDAFARNAEANRALVEELRAKVVLIVLPTKGDPVGQVEAVRAAYRARFKQESLIVLAPPACVTL